MGSIPGSGRFPGEGNGNPLQYSCLKNSMRREAWHATVHGTAKSCAWIKWLNTHTHEQVMPITALDTHVVIRSLFITVVVQLLSHVWLFATLGTAACQALLSFSISQYAQNSCPLNWCCHPSNSSSVAPFSSCYQSFPAPESFPLSGLLTSGGQSIGTSASVLPLILRVDFL